MSALFNSKTALCALAVVGIWGTHGRSGADGSTALISEALDSPTPYILPGTQSALAESFTGLKPVDYILRLLVLFWWETVDGSHPATSAVGLYFLGQLLPCLVIIYFNGLRGDKPSVIKSTLWLLLFQAGAVGATGFIWALAYTIRSPTAQAGVSLEALQNVSIISKLAYLQVLLPALVLGYILPAFIMGLPGSSAMATPALVSDTFKQYAIVAWNVFPLIVLVFLHLLCPFAITKTNTLINQKKATPKSNRAHLRIIRVTTLLTLVISASSHLIISGLSLTTLIFPSIFDPAYINELAPSQIFLPPVSPAPKALTPGDGTRGFLLWDQVVGYSTVLVVVFLEVRCALNAVQAAGPGKNVTLSPWLVGAVGLGLTLVLGPGSALLVGSWVRDEILFGDW
ncbi:hypothetical protein BJY04DRAFT_233374 [Aspergillus karnatakaensis]|uniref:uncharacterized protein n=1 Tax=Aspergillus karnatakaensis TaxID=1810916 RepID=UPI003CCCCA26